MVGRVDGVAGLSPGGLSSADSSTGGHASVRLILKTPTNMVINGNAKALQRRARGYRQFKNYRLALLSACAF